MVVLLEPDSTGVENGEGSVVELDGADADGDREEAVFKKIDWYRKTAMVEGGITGAGGILLGLADFPLLLGIKLKLLFSGTSLFF